MNMAAEKLCVVLLALFSIVDRLPFVASMPFPMMLEVLGHEAPKRECSFSALLLEGRPEDEECNLMLLIRRRINSSSEQFDDDMYDHTRRLAIDAFNRPNRRVDDVETCPASNSICKLEGSRLCICPPQHVCDRVGDTDVHRCAMLAFFNRG